MVTADAAAHQGQLLFEYQGGAQYRPDGFFAHPPDTDLGRFTLVCLQ
jgi:hypothetical protein